MFGLLNFFQVNLTTENTRQVRFNNDGPGAPALAALVGTCAIEDRELASPKKRSAAVDAPSATTATPSVKRATNAAATPASATPIPAANMVPVAAGTPAAATPASSTAATAANAEAEAGSIESNDNDDSGKVVCCNWEAPEDGEAWCSAVLDALAVAVAVDPSAKLAVGFDCEWCPPW